MSSKFLDDLEPEFRARVFEFLARCVEARLPVTIIETRRTVEEQEANVKKGVSWTLKSKHIEGLAIDVCPTELLGYKGWRPDSPLWMQLVAIAEKVGLRAGARWRVRDMPHFEIKEA